MNITDVRDLRGCARRLFVAVVLGTLGGLGIAILVESPGFNAYDTPLICGGASVLTIAT